MTERELQECVRQMCAYTGALCYHTFDARRSEPGFPDCVIVTKDGRTIFAELKSARGALRPAQAGWLTALHRAGQVAVVWRPRDWRDGTIERAIRGDT